MQICLSIAASTLMKRQTVHWVDMADGFSATRLHQVLQARLHRQQVCTVHAGAARFGVATFDRVSICRIVNQET